MRRKPILGVAAALCLFCGASERARAQDTTRSWNERFRRSGLVHRDTLSKEGLEGPETQAGMSTQKALTGSGLAPQGNRGSIDVTYPTRSTVLHNSPGETDVILWTCQDVAYDSVRIDLIPCWDDTVALPDVTVTPGTENDGKFTWSRSAPVQWIKAWPYGVGKYRVRVTADIAKKVYGESDTLLVDDPACGLDLLYPQDGEELCPGEDCEFVWTPKGESGQVPVKLKVVDMARRLTLLDKTA